MSLHAFVRPSAFVPLLMSCAALALACGHLLFFGSAREADEGTAAHLFQLLVAGQLPVIAFFAVRWLRKSPSSGLVVLGAQVFALAVAFAPVWYFHL